MKYLISLYNLLVFFTNQCLLLASKIGLPKVKRKFTQEQLTFQHIGNLKENHVWIHSASAGEFELAIPLIEKIKSKNFKIIATFFSISGYDYHVKNTLIDYCYILPVDSPKNCIKIYELFQPKLVFFVDKELWYNYLSILKATNTPTYLIHAGFNSTDVYFKPVIRSFYQEILKCFSHIFCIYEESEAYLNHLEIKNTSVVGDLRFERNFKKSILSTKRISHNRIKILVVGSAWINELKIISDFVTFSNLSNWRIILVPHEPENKYVSNFISSNLQKFKEINDLDEIVKSSNPYILVTKKGLLKDLYSFADIGWIGIGKGKKMHNVVEILSFYIPVIWVDKYRKYSLSEKLILSGIGTKISDYKDLEKTLDKESNPEISKEIQKLFEENSMVSDNIFQKIDTDGLLVNN